MPVSSHGYCETVEAFDASVTGVGSWAAAGSAMGAAAAAGERGAGVFGVTMPLCATGEFAGLGTAGAAGEDPGAGFAAADDGCAAGAGAEPTGGVAGAGEGEAVVPRARSAAAEIGAVNTTRLSESGGTGRPPMVIASASGQAVRSFGPAASSGIV